MRFFNGFRFGAIGASLLVVTGVAMACGDVSDLVESIDVRAAEISQHLDAVDEELSRHRIAITQMDSLESMQVEEESHFGEIDEHVVAMTHILDELADCEDNMGAAFDVSDTRATLRDLLRRAEDHETEMAQAASVDDAIDLEDSHDAAMGDDVDAMMGHSNGMMSGGHMCMASHEETTDHPDDGHDA